MDGFAQEMAHPERFERPTPRFVVWCSIQLSYGCLPQEARNLVRAGWLRKGRKGGIPGLSTRAMALRPIASDGIGLIVAETKAQN